MTWLAKPPLVRILKGVAVAWLVAALPVFTPPAHANNWGEIAIVAESMGVSDGRICIGDGTRGDIGCPANAPFFNRANGRVGIGTNQPSETLEVYGRMMVGRPGTSVPLLFRRPQDGSPSTIFQFSNGANGLPSDFNLFHNSGDGSFSVSLNNMGEVVPVFRVRGAGHASHIPGVIIGVSPSFFPSATLHVSGTLRIANGGEACDANRTGAIRYTGGDFQFCRNGTAWENLASITNSAASDRITSGTLAVTANSATAIVSLTTGATTWGYLGSTQSYLPNVSAAQVSSTAISTTAVQIASSTTVTACTSTNAGTLRYNSTNTALELCTGSGWQIMGVGIPAGTISAFASTTCPTGWSEYTPARGRFLRGIDNGAGNDPSGTRVPGDIQNDANRSHSHTGTANTSGSHTHTYGDATNSNVAVFTTQGGTGMDGVYLQTRGTNAAGDHTHSLTINADGLAEARPKNVAVTFCQFNGTSNGWNNPLSGGSTVPGGNTGQIQFNSAGAFAGSTGLTWDNANSRLTATNISATSLTVNGVAITGGAGALGDRITSGTTSMIANPSGTIEVNGGIRLLSTTTAPVCTAATAGTIARINGKTYECRM